MLETRPPTFTSNTVEASFKHYVDENGPPEVINVTSSGGGTILPPHPDQVCNAMEYAGLGKMHLKRN